ncbi:hypothetical protein YB2330_002379 [Saitoella coloradoensis]
MSNPISDPSTWTTGHDPVTEKQAAFLEKLATEKGVDVDTQSMDKSEASKKIDELKSSNAPSSAGQAGEGQAPAPKTISDPEQWTTGGDPATERQQRYIAVLERQAGEQVKVDPNMDKTEASEMIEELRQKTGQ